MSWIQKGITSANNSIRGDGEVILFVALAAVNVANFGFHVVISRSLDPDSYGAFVAILGLMLTLSVPVAAFQVAVTRDVAGRHASGEALDEFDLRHAFGRTTLAGAATALALVGAAPALGGFLHLPSRAGVVLLSLFVFLTLAGVLPRAVLLGHLRYRVVAVGVASGTAVRLLSGPLLVRQGFGLEGALGATVLGELVTTLVVLTAVWRSLARGRAHPLAIPWRDAGHAAVALSGFWVMVVADTLLARHYLNGRDSGFYAAAATAGRSSLFVSGSVAMIALPRFAASSEAQRRRFLTLTVAMVTALGLTAACAVSLAPAVLIGVLFGGTYLPSGAALSTLAFASAALGLLNLVTHFHLALAARAALIPWLGAAITTGLVLARHQDIPSIAGAALGGATIAALASTAAAFMRPNHANAGVGRGHDGWTHREPTVDVTVVVPFYNPGVRLTTTISQLHAALDRIGTAYEIIAVSDGSTDGSELALLDRMDEQLHVVIEPKNTGKGHALRIGLARAEGRYVGFIDADGDLDPSSLEAFVVLMRMYEPDVILGSKRHPLSQVSYPPLRRVYSWGYQQLVRVLFHLNIRDTQTGLKLVRREVLDAVLPRMLEKRFAFDLELFVVARRLGYRRLFEAPVRLDHQFTSTISLTAVRGMMLDTLAIFYRTYVLRYYDRNPATKALESHEPNLSDQGTY